MTGRSRAGMLLRLTEGGGHDPASGAEAGPLGSNSGMPPWRFPLRGSGTPGGAGFVRRIPAGESRPFPLACGLGL